MSIQNIKVLGVDLDNTIVNYDALMHQISVERGLISASLAQEKTLIRDTIRKNHGDIEWQKVQGIVYGQRMSEARLNEGVFEFLTSIKQRGIPIYIVSHKTEYSPVDATKTNFRTAAIEFLNKNHFFDSNGLALDPSQNVFFESTRDEKVLRIGKLGCTWFIDDLVETFVEPNFPALTQKVLYSTDQPHEETGATILPTWKEIGNFFQSLEDFSQALKKQVATMKRVSGGKNNKIYKIITSDGEAYIAKIYHRHPGDPRDRLKTEYQSLSFVAKQGATSVPLPLHQDHERGFALYQHIDGTKVHGSEASLVQVEEAARFLIQLKKFSEHPETDMMQGASEAFFSFNDIITNVKQRLAKFDGFKVQDETDRNMLEFLHQRLIPILSQIESQASHKHSSLEKSKRTLSPSDFGFHNAIMRQNGHLVFLDFEYFGWDDPAKMVADFILHPGMNLNQEQTRRFTQVVIPFFSSDAEFFQRFKTLYPLYGIKWCLIILNEFLPDQMARRRFARNAQENESEIKKIQLSKAHAMLDKALNDSYYQS